MFRSAKVIGRPKSSGRRIHPVGRTEPERRRRHGSLPRGQNPTASICATPAPYCSQRCGGARMKSPICVANICVTNRKQVASFRIARLMLAIAPLWFMLAVAGIVAHAQTTPSPADWTQFHRDNMQRWNPYEMVLGVNNVGTLGVKWGFD